MEISKTDYTETLDFTEETKNDWRSLLKEAEAQEKEFKKKKKKKK